VVGWVTPKGRVWDGEALVSSNFRDKVPLRTEPLERTVLLLEESRIQFQPCGLLPNPPDSKEELYKRLRSEGKAKALKPGT